MSDIANTEQTEAVALPSLIDIASEIETIDINTTGLLYILPLGVDHISPTDPDTGEALQALFGALRGWIDRLRSVADHVRAHHEREQKCEGQIKQEANIGRVVSIKPQARPRKGGAA